MDDIDNISCLMASNANIGESEYSKLKERLDVLDDLVCESERYVKEVSFPFVVELCEANKLYLQHIDFEDEPTICRLLMESLEGFKNRDVEMILVRTKSAYEKIVCIVEEE